ncbi:MULTISPECIES: DUF7846 domain-containing protein [unclassified Frankia]
MSSRHEMGPTGPVSAEPGTEPQAPFDVIDAQVVVSPGLESGLAHATPGSVVVAAPRGDAEPRNDTPRSRPDGEQPPAGPPASDDAHGRRAPVQRLRVRLASISGPARYVMVLAVLSAAVAVVLRHTVFPFLSVNNDEGIYLLHARTLAEGRLFPPAPDPAPSYLPWLGTVVGDHYVLKYTPFVPAIFAIGIVLTGSIDPALAMIVMAAVVVTYLLGAELSGSRRTAALAATLLAFSPLVILQSAMVLSYLPTLVLLQVTVLGVLRGRRRRRAAPVVVAGLALGVAAAVRPYDVVLLLAPLAIWLVLTSTGGRWWLCRWLLCGLAAPMVLVLLSNAAATGDPLRLPFALLEPDDKIGFGLRKLYPGDGRHDFGLVEGLQSVGDHLWLFGGWACGGVVLAGCAIVVAARRQLSAPAAVLGAGGLLFLGGYVGFWGAWNAAELWGGIRYVGPFYLVPVLIPLVHLGAEGLVRAGEAVFARGHRFGLTAVAGTGAAILALTAVVLVGAVRANLTLTGHDRDLSAMLDRLPGDPLVFVAVNPPFLGHPTPVTANGPKLDGPVLFAVSRGVDDLIVAADHADRPAYLLRLASAYGRSPASPSTARVERLAVRSGRRVAVTLRVDAAPAGARSARVVLTEGARRLSIPVHPRIPTSMILTVDADGLDITDVTNITSITNIAGGTDSPGGTTTDRNDSGRSPVHSGSLGRPSASTVRDGRGTSITVAYYATSPSGREHFLDHQVLPVRLAARDGSRSDGSRPAAGPPVTVLGSLGEVDEVGEGRRPPLRIIIDDRRG